MDGKLLLLLVEHHHEVFANLLNTTLARAEALLFLYEPPPGERFVALGVGGNVRSHVPTRLNLRVLLRFELHLRNNLIVSLASDFEQIRQLLTFCQSNQYTAIDVTEVELLAIFGAINGEEVLPVSFPVDCVAFE